MPESPEAEDAAEPDVIGAADDAALTGLRVPARRRKAKKSPGKPGSGEVSLFYKPSESIFAAAAPAMVRLGWSCFPQEMDRRPGRVYQETIKWEKDHDLKNRRPEGKVLDQWCAHCATLNLAVVFGPASGHTFAIDIDVTDARMCAEIVAIAEEILGVTPFRRVGRAPKIALIYRHGSAESERIPSISRHFAVVDANGNATKGEHQIEILGEGKLLTFHGKHHKTGRYFKWLDASPLMSGPELAPLVTAERLQTFLEAVDARFRFHRGASFVADASSWQWDEETKARIPKLSVAAGGSAWSEDADGKVSDGREAYLVHLIWHTVLGNLDTLEAARDAGPAALQMQRNTIASAVAQHFTQTAVMDTKWTVAYVRQQAAQKTKHLIEKWSTERLVLRSTMHRPGTVANAEPAASSTQFVMPRIEPDKDLSFLMPNTGNRHHLTGRIEAPDPAAPSLAIPADRRGITAAIHQGIMDGLASFFDDVYAERKHAVVHVLRAPPGAGKTSQLIRFIARDERTYKDHRWTDADGRSQVGRAPIIMLMPTYANIEEVRERASVLNLDPTLSDDDLRNAARGIGLLAPDDVPARVAEIRRDALGCTAISGDERGFVTMIYSGKIKAGCFYSEKIEMAMSAGIGSSGLCKATAMDEKPKKGSRPAPSRPPAEREILCDRYHECEAIRQKAMIAQAHVVFMPHAFMSLSIPDELLTARAVIADERVHHLFLHTTVFSATSLSIARRRPRLTAREKKDNVDPDGLLMDRDAAASVALDAMRSGRCPALALHREGDRGLAWVDAALRVCGTAIQRDGTVTPKMPFDKLREMCAQPTGRDVREEHRFWKIVQERIKGLRQDELLDAVMPGLEAGLADIPADAPAAARDKIEKYVESFRRIPRKAPGAHDHRIQYLTENTVNGGTSELVRISWRTVPNWGGIPVLLLDASAAPPIIAKIWKLPLPAIRIHPVVDDIGMAMNVKTVAVVDRTFSNSSLVASPSSAWERVRAAKNLSRVRLAISAISSLFGDGRLVGGTTILLRKVINSGWACPDNFDWCHFGAMRGLDMFKHHQAAISIGRMEVPTRTIDGLVAALTYDDQDPEPPFDRRGDGMDPEDPAIPLRLPMGEQRIRLRSGHTAVVPVPMFPGHWSRMIQEQYREEELNQFVGRLRPVYRTGRTPVWFALSTVLPAGIIVDEVVHVEDLVQGPLAFWECVRRTNGVLHPELVFATCPEMIKSVDAAVAMLEASGFGVEDPSPAQSRLVRGFRACRWRKAGSADPWRDVFVMRHATDAVSRVLAAFEKVLDRSDIEVEVTDDDLRSLARARPDDKVQKLIGTAPERREEEAARRYRLEQFLLDDTGEILKTLGEVRYQTSKSGSQGLSARELDALLSIEEYWRRQEGIADDRTMPLIADVPDEIVEGSDYSVYEKLGDTAVDADRAAA